MASRPKLKRRKKRKIPVWRSEEERGDIIDLFKKMQAQGLQCNDIAKALKTPLSSVYSWLRKAHITSDQKLLRWGTPDSINEAIDIITRDKATQAELLEAIFLFVVWKRWPTASQNLNLGVTSCITSYFALSREAITISELQHSDKEFLLKYLRLDVLRRMCSTDFFELPIFDLFPVDEKGHDEFDFLAEIAEYFIYWPETFKNDKIKPSLNKAFNKVEDDFYICKWKPSRRMFWKTWSENAPATPFHFVERVDSSLNWTINPSDPDFDDAVHAFLAQLPLVRAYFAKCKWATERLERTLNERALANIRFPCFPASLVSEPIALSK